MMSAGLQIDALRHTNESIAHFKDLSIGQIAFHSQVRLQICQAAVEQADETNRQLSLLNQANLSLLSRLENADKFEVAVSMGMKQVICPLFVGLCE
jgi:hypothetical protein